LKRISTFSRTSVVLMLCLAMASPSLSAAEFHGLVKFNGLAVPGVSITVAMNGKTYIAITNMQGLYQFKDLPDGPGTIQIEMLGFTTIKQDINVNSAVPFNPTWELKLQTYDELKAIAAPEAPVPVTAPTTATSTTGTASGTPAAATPAPAAANAPKPGSVQRANVNATGQQNASQAAAEPEPSSDDAGKNQAAATDGFLVNGSVNNAASSPFAQSAAFGNNRRPGRSLYNGSLMAQIDNSVFDARQFSLTGQDVAKPAFNRFTGGAQFGGPIKWPHNVRNPVNVTLAFQWVHNSNASTSSPLQMPTGAERGGNFAGLTNAQAQPITIYDPKTGLPFANNLIPTTRLSPQALALVPYYPLPNFTSGSNYNFETPLVSSTHQDAGRANFNKTLTQKDQIFGLVAIQSSRGASTSALGFLDTTDSLGMNTNVNWMHRISSRMFITTAMNYSRNSIMAAPFFANHLNVSGNAGITGNDQSPVNWGPPTLGFSSGIASISDSNFISNHTEQFSPTFQMFWNHNPHSLRYGFDYRRNIYNYFSESNPRGTFGFTGTATGVTAGGVATPGYDFADFLLGTPDISQIAFGNADKYLRQNWYDAYVTDDYRLNSSISLTLGVRWDYIAPITEKYDRLVNLDVAPGYGAIKPVTAQNPTGPLTGNQYGNSLMHPDHSMFQPRLAVAWRPLPASSLVVRAGYSVNYNTSVYQSIAQQMTQQSPFSKTANLTNSAATPLTLANGFTSAPNAVTNTFAVDPNFRIGYAQAWNLSIQRDLPAALVLRATYAGIKGTRQVQVFFPNTYPNGVTNPCSVCQSGYQYMASNGNSTRESGSVELRRRLHNGFTATLDYTYSKSIDNAALGGGGTGGTVIAQNWLNLDGERGLSPFDQRHLMQVQMQYSTGVGKAGGTLLDGWRGALYKDWTLTSNINVGSGLPLTPTDSAATVAGLSGSVRPHYTGQNVYASSGTLFLNPQAYTAPLFGEWGDAGRDSIIGPGRFSLNASMARDFRLNDRLTATLRFDSTNTLNHVTFGSYVTNISSSQFGLAQSPNNMRTLQTTFRLRF